MLIRFLLTRSPDRELTTSQVLPPLGSYHVPKTFPQWVLILLMDPHTA